MLRPAPDDAEKSAASSHPPHRFHPHLLLRQSSTTCCIFPIPAGCVAAIIARAAIAVMNHHEKNPTPAASAKKLGTFIHALRILNHNPSAPSRQRQNSIAMEII